MVDKKSCYRGGCTRHVVATLRAEAYCLDHFSSRCYEELRRIDVEGASEASQEWAARQLTITDECARRTLDVCMGTQMLNNLERARLLDILLWCGELVSSLQKKLPVKAPRQRLPYEKPEVRKASAAVGL